LWGISFGGSSISSDLAKSESGNLGLISYQILSAGEDARITKFLIAICNLGFVISFLFSGYSQRSYENTVTQQAEKRNLPSPTFGYSHVAEFRSRTGEIILNFFFFPHIKRLEKDDISDDIEPRRQSYGERYLAPVSICLIE